jgi:transcriptional regulator with XRE-family HTH domain
MKKAAKTKTRSPTSMDGQIGLRIRHIRLQQKISQSDLGEKLGVSFQQVQKYERGVNRLTLSRAIDLAKALNTTVNELAGLNGVGKLSTVTFNSQIYKLSQVLNRIDGLVERPGLANKFFVLIESVCEDLEANGKKKR